MATLFDRLFGDTGDIAVHTFHAAIVDYMAGETTRAQLIAGFGLDAESTVQLDTLLAVLDGLSSVQEQLRFVAEMDAVNILAESGLRYTTASAYATRLGLT